MSFRDDKILRPVWLFTLNHLSPQAQGLVAWWPMALGGGQTAFDLARSSYHLTGGAGAAQPTWGDGMRFARASSQYAQIETGILTAVPLTLSCWVRAFDLVNGQQPVCLVNRDSDNNWFSLVINGGTNQGGAQTHSGVFAAATTPTGIESRRWHLLTGVFAAANSRTAYLDGRAGSTETTSTTPTGINRTAIGGLRRMTPTEFFDGELFDVRIYNRALSAAEVYALHDPTTRYDLYWELGRRATFIPPPLVIEPNVITQAVSIPNPTVIRQATAGAMLTSTDAAVTILTASDQRVEA